MLIACRQIRKTLNLLESLEDNTASEAAPETVPTAPDAFSILADLKALSSKLREYMDPDGGDVALGVETGMQRAAEMIDNLLRRYSEGDHLEP